jgi:hypothetical protein
LLEQRQPQKAMEHFREALRLDPEMEWARLGIVEAMKARHFIYRVMLGYMLWMAKLPPRAQWGVIIGGYFGMQFLSGVGRNNPELAPWLLPLQIAYLAFAIMTWIAYPLFNLLLRLNRFGRLALSREEIVASNWLGGCIFTALAMLIAYFATGEFAPGWAAFVFGVLAVPVSAVFRCRQGRPRTLMAAYTVGMLVIGLGRLVPLLWLVIPSWLPAEGVEPAINFGNWCNDWFIWVAVGSTWAANVLASSRQRH